MDVWGMNDVFDHVVDFVHLRGIVLSMLEEVWVEVLKTRPTTSHSPQGQGFHNSPRHQNGSVFMPSVDSMLILRPPGLAIPLSVL